MPLIRSGGVWQTPWSEGQNVRHLEPLGFIKFDLLGLSTLKMIEGAITHILRRHHGVENPTYKEVRAYYEEKLNPDTLDFNDSKVWDVFKNIKKAPGIFQFAETGMQGFCSRVAPTSLEELSAVTSIYRPGPLSANVDDDYVKTKRGQKKPHYEHPILKEILEKNFGFIIYQEDLAKIAHKMGKGISLTEGNKLRKLLTKQGTGTAGSEKVKIHDKFIVGCVEKGMTSKAAEKLWQKMEYFSGYGFNASHAYSYSIISYQCAYLFAYYAPEWVAAFLDKEPDSRKEKAIGKAKGLGFDITNLNVNTSGRVWEISEDGKALIPPLTSIKGLGDKAIDQVFVGRPYNNIEEFLFHPDVTYSKLNKKSVDVLVRSGTLNTLFNCFANLLLTGLPLYPSAGAPPKPLRGCLYHFPSIFTNLSSFLK
jgi:DNA polymerase-3 subunit alpha